MSSTVTIPKIKYESLAEKAEAYEKLINAISKGGFFESPPTRKSSEIMKAFKETGIYNKKFLESLKKGIERSSYFV